MANMSELAGSGTTPGAEFQACGSQRAPGQRREEIPIGITVERVFITLSQSIFAQRPLSNLVFHSL